MNVRKDKKERKLHRFFSFVIIVALALVGGLADARTWKASASEIDILKRGGYVNCPLSISYSGVQYLRWATTPGGQHLRSSMIAKSVTLTAYGSFPAGTIVASPAGTYTGQCPDLVKSMTGAPSTGYWRRGSRVTAGGVAVGTAIATFSTSTTYSGHCGIFGGYVNGDPKRFLIWDMNWDKTIFGLPSLVSRHTLVSTGTGLSDSDAYYVINTQ